MLLFAAFIFPFYYLLSPPFSVISCFFSSGVYLKPVVAKLLAAAPGLGLRGMLFLFLQYTCVRVCICVRVHINRPGVGGSLTGTRHPLSRSTSPTPCLFPPASRVVVARPHARPFLHLLRVSGVAIFRVLGGPGHARVRDTHGRLLLR